MAGYLLDLLLMLLVVSVFGYALTILKEKYYLWNNIIFIDSKTLSERDIEDIDTKHFRLGSVDVMAGDEMKIYFNNHGIIKGTILGAKLQDNCMLIITNRDLIQSVYIKDIKDFKITSKYGKIFKKF